MHKTSSSFYFNEKHVIYCFRYYCTFFVNLKQSYTFKKNVGINSLWSLCQMHQMMCKTLWIGHNNSLHNISFELKNILASKMHGTKEYSIILQTHSQKAWLEWKCFAYLLSKIKRLNSFYETKIFLIKCIHVCLWFHWIKC